jgi:hypothetical protein
LSKVPALLISFALTTFACALGCSSSITCQPIPDGVYVAIGPDGGAIIAPAITVDAGDAAAVDAAVVDAAADDAAASGGPVTYAFQGGLPAPYVLAGGVVQPDQWSCTPSPPGCVMTYACTQGDQKVSVVTSYSPGFLAFSITPPGTIVTLRAP